MRDAAGDQDGSDPDKSAETARCPLPRQEDDVTQLVTVEQDARVYARGCKGSVVTQLRFDRHVDIDEDGNLELDSAGDG